MPLPLRGNEDQFQHVLRYERNRINEVLRLPLDDVCLAQLARLLSTLDDLHEMARAGGAEEAWQQRTSRCNRAFITATLYGFNGEPDTCISVSWGTLRDADIL